MTFAFDELDWDDELRAGHRGAGQPTLRTRSPAWSPTSALAVVRPWSPRSSGDSQRLAELDLPAPQRRWRDRGALTLLRQPRDRHEFDFITAPDTGIRTMKVSTEREDSEQRRPLRATVKPAEARLRRGNPNFLDWWMRYGADRRVPRQGPDLPPHGGLAWRRDGWAHFDYVKMPDYRWGIFLSPREPETGSHHQVSATTSVRTVWDRKCRESMRKELRRIIVTQGDTEPASPWSSSASWVTVRAQPVRPAQPLPGQRGGGAAPLGHGVPAAPVTSGSDGREEAEDSCWRAAPATWTTPRILEHVQRSRSR